MSEILHCSIREAASRRPALVDPAGLVTGSRVDPPARELCGSHVRELVKTQPTSGNSAKAPRETGPKPTAAPPLRNAAERHLDYPTQAAFAADFC
jgi:hypothetical protein